MHKLRTHRKRSKQIILTIKDQIHKKLKITIIKMIKTKILLNFLITLLDQIMNYHKNRSRQLKI